MTVLEYQELPQDVLQSLNVMYIHLVNAYRKYGIIPIYKLLVKVCHTVTPLRA